MYVSNSGKTAGRPTYFCTGICAREVLTARTKMAVTARGTEITNDPWPGGSCYCCRKIYRVCPTTPSVSTVELCYGADRIRSLTAATNGGCPGQRTTLLECRFCRFPPPNFRNARARFPRTRRVRRRRRFSNDGRGAYLKCSYVSDKTGTG